MTKPTIDLRDSEDNWHKHLHRKKEQRVPEVPKIPPMNLVFDAIELAAQRHRGQLRKGTRIPYMVHLMNVAALLAARHCDPEVIAGGVLHDIVEDTATELEEVQRRFGDRIACIVDGTTEPEKKNKYNPSDEKGSWEERKQHTIDFVAKEATVDVLVVSCADKLDNMTAIANDFESIGDQLWKRFNAPEARQRWYYQGLAAAFAGRATESEVLADLSQALTQQVRRVFG